MHVRSQTVHSGHFMVSNLEDSDDELNCTEKTCDITTSEKDKMFELIDGHRVIFENLTSLMKFMKIAYKEKLTSPKWNQFKGLHFDIRNKVRLNNIIWREYHMQCKFFLIM